MSTNSFTLELFNTQIFGQIVQPVVAKGVVVLVHGLGEHGGRYKENVIPLLVETGFAVIAFDNFGHGKSGGKRGHCPSYGALLDLLETMIEKANEHFKNLPLFLYGHSMGGNLVLNYGLRHKESRIQGIVATSPYLRLAFKPPLWKMVLGKLMLGIWPSLTMPSGLDPKGISRITEEVKSYLEDPLVHDKVSPMFSFPIMEAGDWAIANASRLKVETLLLHGMADPIIDFRGTEEFHRNSKKTTLKLFEGGYHELHHDACKNEVLSTIQIWLREKI